MADENLNYETLIDEIKEEMAPERMVEMRKELEKVPPAERNDDHKMVYDELMEKAQKNN